MTLIITTIKNGRPVFTEVQQKTMSATFKLFEGKQIKIELKAHKSTRTLNQNAYLWGVVYTYIAAETGHTTEEIHEYMKQMFLGREFITIGGKEKQIGKSTTRMTTAEFAEYTENIRVFAAQSLNLTIPLPDES